MFGRNRFRLLVEFVRALCQVTRASLVFAPFPLLSPIRSERTAHPGPASASRRRGRRSRRGIILLFILGLLALFSLVTVTFVVVARIHKRGASFAAQVERTGDSPEGLMTQAALQAIRGTNNPRSVLGPHSLLEDLYGSDHLQATISVAPTALTNGQLMQFTIAAESGYLFEQKTNFYAGRVLTVRSGNSAGRSWRILGNDNVGAFTVLAEGVRLNGGAVVNERGAVVLNVNDRVLINGVPFNGTGFGFSLAAAQSFNPAAPAPAGGAIDNRILLGAFDSNLPADPSGRYPEYALLPNMAAYTLRPSDAGYDSNYFNAVYNPAGLGGADEEYDAVDFQNMLLAMRVVTSTTTSVDYPSNVLIPSLHRPELINYWTTRMGVADWKLLDPKLLRRVMMRPLGAELGTNADHPNFTGSNPGPNPFHAILGQQDIDGNNVVDYTWDVDNDGDGKPDSVWVDIGLPVQSTPDGRTYKPLVAILCEDMDGKLNLNAHGTFNHIVQTSTTSGSVTELPSPPTFTTEHSSLIGGVNQTNSNIASKAPFAGTATAGTQTTLAVGGGYGPAEINLNLLLGAYDFSRVMFGDSTAAVRLQGRYGEINDTAVTLPLPGRAVEPFDSRAAVLATNRVDLSSWLKQFEFPDDYFNQGGGAYWQVGAFGSPPDLDGDGSMGLDPSGHPIYPLRIMTSPASLTSISLTPYVGMGEFQDRWNNPYQIDLSDKAPRSTYSGGVVTLDAPFQPIELERVLRANDLDAGSLPNRINQLATNTIGGTAPNVAHFRYRITTDSWDLPTPGIVPTADAAMSLTIGAFPSPGLDAATAGSTVYGRLSFLNLVQKRMDRDEIWRSAAGLAGNAFTSEIGQLLPLFGPEMRQGLRFDLNRPFGNGLDDNANQVIDDPAEASTGAGEPLWTGSFASPVYFDHDNDGTTGTADLFEVNARLEYAKNLYLLMMLVMDEQFSHTAYTPTDYNRRLALATQIAQWAVNVVDFRDRDSIMTGFEFDVFPFTDESAAPDSNPWDVDNNLATDDAALGPNVKRGVVWGAERPELLITETLAFHDRNTNDGNDGGGTVSMGDTGGDWDQVNAPESGFYVELFKPWQEDGLAPSPEFSSLTPNVVALDKATGGSPVWRLMVTTTNEAPDRVTLGSTHAASKVDRLIYFTSSMPADTVVESAYVTEERHHRAGAAPALNLIAGGYAVIGTEGVVRAGHSGTSRLNMTSTLFRATDAGGSPTLPYSGIGTGTATDNIRQPLAVAIDQLDGGAGKLSLTEPKGGYTTALPNGTPFDKNRPDLTNPAELWIHGTISDHRWVHLQRLANPLLPWHPESNPYRTIDTAPIDLSVYNRNDNPATPAEPTLTSSVAANFNSQQRDGRFYGSGTPSLNLWAQSFSKATPAGGAPGDPTPVAQNSAPNHTLGYLNSAFYDATNPRLSADATANPYQALSGTRNYIGMPSGVPFPHFHWPNRPFVSAYELLQVPAYPSSLLLTAHGLRDPALTNRYYYNPTVGPLSIPNITAEPLWWQDMTFRQALPFFVTRTPVTGNFAPQLHRLFDFVHIPSRFAGTDDFLNPTQFQTGTHIYHPPYNKVSRYREPGKININTIFDDGLAWMALTNQFPDRAIAFNYWNAVLNSRRGWNSTVNNPTPIYDPTSPTLFANPFRSSAGNFLVPVDALRRGDTNSARVAQYSYLRQGIDSTLLRPTPSAAPGTNDVPLFAYNNDAAGSLTSPPLATLATNTNRNSCFHYQLLQKLGNNVTTRSNVYAIWITLGYFEVTRVAPRAGDPGFCPDGWQLGRELGSDTGEINRHRAFYLIDRTRPVGFLRGEDLNVRDCFLIQRFIE